MPDGNVNLSGQYQRIEPGKPDISRLFDGDCPLSKAKATQSGNLSMQIEILQRERLISTITDMAFKTEAQGYRLAGALLLEVAANIQRALISTCSDV